MLFLTATTTFVSSAVVKIVYPITVAPYPIVDFWSNLLELRVTLNRVYPDGRTKKAYYGKRYSALSPSNAVKLFYPIIATSSCIALRRKMTFLPPWLLQTSI